LIFDYEPEHDVFRKYEKSQNPSLAENDNYISNDQSNPDVKIKSTPNGISQDVNISLSKDLKIFNNEFLSQDTGQNNIIPIQSESETTKLIKDFNSPQQCDSNKLSQNTMREGQIQDSIAESNNESDRKVIISKSTKQSIVDETN